MAYYSLVNPQPGRRFNYAWVLFQYVYTFLWGSKKIITCYINVFHLTYKLTHIF